MIIQCEYAFSYNVMKIKNQHNKYPDIFVWYIFRFIHFFCHWVFILPRRMWFVRGVRKWFFQTNYTDFSLFLFPFLSRAKNKYHLSVASVSVSSSFTEFSYIPSICSSWWNGRIRRCIQAREFFSFAISLQLSHIPPLVHYHLVSLYIRVWSYRKCFIHVITFTGRRSK